VCFIQFDSSQLQRDLQQKTLSIATEEEEEEEEEEETSENQR
jgi:hypothetical protein